MMNTQFNESVTRVLAEMNSDFFRASEPILFITQCRPKSVSDGYPTYCFWKRCRCLYPLAQHWRYFAKPPAQNKQQYHWWRPSSIHQPGSVAEQRQVGIGHGALAARLLKWRKPLLCFPLRGHESFVVMQKVRLKSHSTSNKSRQPIKGNTQWSR